MKKGENTSGQALLIILLVLSVALTTGLALVARTTTDISISEKETASSKAFEAAEAGIEEALKAIETKGDFPSSLTLTPGGEEAIVTIQQSEAGDEAVKQQIFPGETTTFWLNSITLEGEDFPADDISYGGTTLTFCWDGAENVEAAVYYQDEGYKVARYYLGGGEGCQGLTKSDTINLPTGAKFVNVRFYSTDSSQQLTVTTNEALSRQGTTVEAEAKVGDVARKISVFQGWPQVPSFFDFAVLSAGSLTKTE